MADASAHLDEDLDVSETLAWPPAGETPEARAARITRERAMIEEADEDFRRGDYLEGADLKERFRKRLAGEPLPEDPG